MRTALFFVFAVLQSTCVAGASFSCSQHCRSDTLVSQADKQSACTEACETILAARANGDNASLLFTMGVNYLRSQVEAGYTQPQPWLEGTVQFTAPPQCHVTGSDAPLNARASTLYFTCLDGEVYAISTKPDDDGDYPEPYLAGRVNPNFLDTSHGHGLYDIAFHHRHDENELVYLIYASPYDTKVAPHHTVIEEYNLTSIMSPGGEDGIVTPRRLIPNRFLHVEPHNAEHGSFGWLDATARSRLRIQPPMLYYAIGGNAHGDEQLNADAPRLSGMHAIELNNPAFPHTLHATGLHDPRSCSASWQKSREIYCLLQQHNGTVVLRALRQGYNYDELEYHPNCKAAWCEKPYNRPIPAPLLTFEPGTYIDSIMLYSGHRIRNLIGKILLLQSAHYDITAKRFMPAVVYYMARDEPNNRNVRRILPTRFELPFLVNATFVYADSTNAFYVAGHSLETGTHTIQRLIPNLNQTWY